MSEQLLFVGKHPANLRLCDYLEAQGFAVTRTAGLRSTLRALAENNPALIIIDTVDTSTTNVRRITHAGGHQHQGFFVILLVDNHGAAPKGAIYDAYLVRPFTPRQLETQVRNLLGGRQDQVVSLGPLTLDRRTMRLRGPRGISKLTPKQFQLLDYLIENRGKVVSRRELMQAVWETAYVGDTRTLDVHVRWLREQIEEDPSHPQLLLTHRGRGYSLDLEGELLVGGAPITD